jgi:hypothetical protein
MGPWKTLRAHAADAQAYTLAAVLEINTLTKNKTEKLNLNRT